MRAFGRRATPGIESSVVDVCHAQVLSIIWWLVSGRKADIHREVCACVRVLAVSVSRSDPQGAD